MCHGLSFLGRDASGRVESLAVFSAGIVLSVRTPINSDRLIPSRFASDTITSHQSGGWLIVFLEHGSFWGVLIFFGMLAGTFRHFVGNPKRLG
jgi:hypothetical protein